MADRFTPSQPLLSGSQFQVVQVPPSPQHSDEEPHTDSGSDDEHVATVALLEPAAHAPAVPVAHAVSAAPAVRNRITSEEKFWQYIEELMWRDASEDLQFSLENKKQKFLTLSISDQEAFAGFLEVCVNALHAKFVARNLFGTLVDPSEQRAVCSHIVGKGSVAYALTMEDPDFYTYLLPQNTGGKKEYHSMLALIPPI